MEQTRDTNCYMKISGQGWRRAWRRGPDTLFEFGPTGLYPIVFTDKNHVNLSHRTGVKESGKAVRIGCQCQWIYILSTLVCFNTHNRVVKLRSLLEIRSPAAPQTSVALIPTVTLVHVHRRRYLRSASSHISQSIFLFQVLCVQKRALCASFWPLQKKKKKDLKCVFLLVL